MKPIQKIDDNTFSVTTEIAPKVETKTLGSIDFEVERLDKEIVRTNKILTDLQNKRAVLIDQRTQAVALGIKVKVDNEIIQ